MNRRLVMGTMVMAVSVMSSEAMHAAGVGHLHAALNVGKMVKFSLRNDTNASMKLMAGATEITLAPGKPVAVTLPAGTTIVSEQAEGKIPAGTTLSVVSDGLGHATLAIR